MAFSPPSFHQVTEIAAGDYFEAAKAYALRLRRYYDARARWHRRFYRLSGILIILGGSSLPVISTRNLTNKDLIVSIIGVAISALTAMRSFYRWDESWILLRKTEIEISGIYFDWRAKYDQESSSSNQPSAELYKITSEMVTALAKARNNEANSFFKNLSFPQKT
jgi:hypothetical protein